MNISKHVQSVVIAQVSSVAETLAKARLLVCAFQIEGISAIGMVSLRICTVLLLHH